MKRCPGLASFVAGLVLVGALSALPAAAQQAQRPVIYLNQAWSQADREWYYQFSQGSTVVFYDIFLNLEVAGSEELFRSDANSERFGLITQAPSPMNPDGLPVGLAKGTLKRAYLKGEIPGDYIGLTCAACHNSELYYQGKRIRIDGGISTIDLSAYIYALDDALQATLKDPAKFDRLATRLKASGDAKAALRARLENNAARVNEYRTRTLVTLTDWGPHRMDAIALIVNRLTNILPAIPENWSTPLAPTKPPFLWNAPQGLWTQWRGVQQVPIDRNLVETMGVFMSIDLQSKSPKEGLFDSNAAIENLGQVENLLARLAPPSWPEDVLGKIDRDKARQGKDLFVALCSGCHNVWPYNWTEPNKYGKRFVLVGLTPQSYVGTDPNQFETARPYAISAQLAPYMPGPFKDKPLVDTGAMYLGTQRAVLESALAKLKLTDAQLVNLLGYRVLPTPRPPERVYKAAPRDGVWATPPFMHNGSVPNLYEMLVPAAQRTKKFCYGREFDPVKVGLDTRCTPGAFELDTALRGNSNAGHSFEDAPRGSGVIGPLLTDDQRWALVEYLKSIPEEPGRVTPFGGPPAR
ncbi:MAG: di-heme-cytochrome C peroxidase [Burkholderiales bacterium]